MKNYLILLLYLFIGFVPYFGTIDTIGSQWFYLSIINISCLFLFIFDFDLIVHIKSLLKFVPFKIYLFFIIVAFFSLFFSKNISLSLVDFSRLLTTTLSVLIISFLFISSQSFNLYRLSLFISFVLLCEIVYSYFPLFRFLASNSFFDIDYNSIPNSLKGVTGNKNVNASNIAFKIPFVIYLIYKTKIKFKFFPYIIFIFSCITLFLLSARATFLSLFLVLLFSLFSLIKSFNRSILTDSILILFFAGLSSFLVTSITSNSINVSNRLSTINKTDESASLRLTLWDNAIDYISSNPIIGSGIGTWKTESLPYWKDKLTGYKIPYHAHNDFLEITAEIGLIGGFAYLLFFIVLFFKGLIGLNNKDNFRYVLLLSLLSVYFIDAFFNFPLERTISQINFAILFSLTIYLSYYEQKSIS